jgi:hypothetical protein
VLGHCVLERFLEQLRSGTSVHCETSLDMVPGLSTKALRVNRRDHIRTVALWRGSGCDGLSPIETRGGQRNKITKNHQILMATSYSWDSPGEFKIFVISLIGLV